MNKALILLPLLLVPLESCKKASANPAPDQAANSATQETGTDILVRDRVMLALSQERSLREDYPNVRVEVHEGVVKLTGTASNEENKRRFYVVANAVGSVVSVDNQIVIRHP